MDEQSLVLGIIASGRDFVFFAHLIGTSTPILGKFVEAARSFEGKASLIYASPLFLACGADLLGSLDGSGLNISPISAAVAASSIASASPVSTVGGGLFGLAVFGVICLTNQAVHTKVLLSPSMLNYGIFYLILLNVQKGEKIPTLALPPRYRGSETALATFMGCQATPSVLRGGPGGAWTWLKTLLSGY